jgi:hypothetical protein
MTSGSAGFSELSFEPTDLVKDCLSPSLEKVVTVAGAMTSFVDEVTEDFVEMKADA